MSPGLTLTVFVMMGEAGGERTLQQSVSYEVEPCQEHRVTTVWSADQVSPGSEVNLEISSEQNSLCGLSATDQVN